MGINLSELFLAGIVLLYGIITLLVNYSNRSRILLSDIYVIVAAFLVGLAPFISVLTGNRDLPELSNPLVYTYLSFLLFFIGLGISKLFFHKLLFGDRRVTKDGRRSPVFYLVERALEIPLTNIIFIFIVVFALKIYDFSVGSGISGFNTVEVQLSKNYLVLIISHLTQPFSYILYFYTFASFYLRRVKLWVFTVPITLYMALDAFLGGRREMIFLIVFALFTALAIQRRIKISQAVFAGIGIVFVFSVLSPLFLEFRTASKQVSQSIYASDIGEVMGFAAEDAMSSDRRENLERSMTNVGYRVLGVRSVLLWIFEAQQSMSPLWGKATFHMVGSSLPRFLRPNIGWLGSEQYIQLQYNMTMVDVSGSIPMLFIADFSLPGALFGGLIFGLYLNGGLALSLVLWRRYPAVGMACFSYLFFASINTEQSPSFITIMPRNILLLFIVFWGLRQTGFRLKNMDLLPPEGIRKC